MSNEVTATERAAVLTRLGRDLATAERDRTPITRVYTDDLRTVLSLLAAKSVDLKPEPCACHGLPYCEDDK